MRGLSLAAVSGGSSLDVVYGRLTVLVSHCGGSGVQARDAHAQKLWSWV